MSIPRPNEKLLNSGYVLSQTGSCTIATVTLHRIVPAYDSYVFVYGGRGMVLLVAEYLVEVFPKLPSRVLHSSAICPLSRPLQTLQYCRHRHRSSTGGVLCPKLGLTEAPVFLN